MVSRFAFLSCYGCNILEEIGIPLTLRGVAPEECTENGWATLAMVRATLRVGGRASDAVIAAQRLVRGNYDRATQGDIVEMPWDHNMAYAFLGINPFSVTSTLEIPIEMLVDKDM